MPRGTGGECPSPPVDAAVAGQTNPEAPQTFSNTVSGFLGAPRPILDFGILYTTYRVDTAVQTSLNGVFLFFYGTAFLDRSFCVWLARRAWYRHMIGDQPVVYTFNE